MGREAGRCPSEAVFALNTSVDQERAAASAIIKLSDARKRRGM